MQMRGGMNGSQQGWQWPQQGPQGGQWGQGPQAPSAGDMEKQAIDDGMMKNGGRAFCVNPGTTSWNGNAQWCKQQGLKIYGTEQSPMGGGMNGMMGGPNMMGGQGMMGPQMGPGMNMGPSMMGPMGGGMGGPGMMGPQMGPMDGGMGGSSDMGKKMMEKGLKMMQKKVAQITKKIAQLDKRIAKLDTKIASAQAKRDKTTDETKQDQLDMLIGQLEDQQSGFSDMKDELEMQLEGMNAMLEESQNQ